MREYKVVPCQGRVIVKPKEDLGSAFNAFAETVAQEALGGWELVSVMPVSVVTKKARMKTEEELAEEKEMFDQMKKRGKKRLERKKQ